MSKGLRCLKTYLATTNFSALGLTKGRDRPLDAKANAMRIYSPTPISKKIAKIVGKSQKRGCGEGVKGSTEVLRPGPAGGERRITRQEGTGET